MEEKKEKLFINGVSVYLEEIQYLSKDETSMPNEVQISQELQLVDCTKECVTIRMKRTISSDKTEDYKLYVSSVGKFYLDEKTFESFTDLDTMKKYASSKMGFIVDKVQMGHVLTQLIANITGTFGRSPFIIPPIINGNIRPEGF